MDTRTLQQRLNDHGFPCGAVDGIIGRRTKLAVAKFQAAHAFDELAVDEICGPKTEAALAKLPYLAPHFQVIEVRCRHCGTAWVRRELLVALEVLRERVGPIAPASGYRCVAHNRAVGGVSNSQHLEGTAVDLVTHVTVAEAQAVGVFSGIGSRGQLAAHVDVRHVLGNRNPTPGRTPASPARWKY